MDRLNAPMKISRERLGHAPGFEPADVCTHTGGADDRLAAPKARAHFLFALNSYLEREWSRRPRMSVEVTHCPRCESASAARLQEPIRWRCNQCSHQWDFASPEERALIPNHLTGSRGEQFLEKFVAIKAQIKSEAEKIWNGCFNVHQMIAVTSDDDKRRVFSEQFEIWRNRLIELQEILIGNRLLPLVVEYRIAENEQMWLLEACQEAWNPVAAGYLDWLTFVVRGSLHGVGTGAIPKWAWQLPSGPRDVVPLESAPEKKASGHFSRLEYRLQRDLDMHRKGAIAKAFLVEKTSRSSTVDGGRGRLEISADHRPAPLTDTTTDSAEIQSAFRRQDPALTTASHNSGGNILGDSRRETPVSGVAVDEKVRSTVRRKRTTRAKPPCFEAAVDQLRSNSELTLIEFCRLMDRKAEQYPTTQKYRPPKSWKVRSFRDQYDIRRNTISRFLYSVRQVIRSERG
jgi:hypothetical protein